MRRPGSAELFRASVVLAVVALTVNLSTPLGNHLLVSPRPSHGATSLPVGSFPDDWPTFMGNVQRTGVNSGEQMLSRSSAPNLSLSWSYTTAGPVEGPATVVNGTVYFGSWDGYEYALNATTGTSVWKTYLGQVTNPYCSWMSPIGVTAGATVIGKTLYVEGGDAQYYSLNATNGKVLWNFSLGTTAAGGTYLWASPLLYKGYVYVGVASQCDNPLVQGKLIRASASTGAIVNTFYTVGSATNYQTGGSIWSTPALDPSSNTIWVTTGNEDSGSTYARCVVALNATTLAVRGSWQQPLPGYDYDFGAGATVAGSGTGSSWVFATNKDGYTSAFNRTNVTSSGWGPIWQDQTTSFKPLLHPPADAISPAAWDGSVLYVGGGNTSIRGTVYPGSVRAIAPSTGAYLWEHAAPGVVRGGVVYANGLVVDNAVSKKVANSSTLEVLNSGTGVVIWSRSIPWSMNSNPTIAEGKIFVGAGSTGIMGWDTYPGGNLGRLYAFSLVSPTPRYSVTIGEIGLPVRTVWSATLNGTVQSTNSSSLTFTEPSGSFPFTIGSVSGYRAAPSSGFVNVGTANRSFSVTFSPLAKYAVNFTESGLPSRTNWSVLVTGTGAYSGSTTNSSTSSSIRFYFPSDFTGDFRVRPVAGYDAIPATGSLSIMGLPQSVAVGFQVRLYPVSFVLQGPNPPPSWMVTLAGVANQSAGTTIGFEEPNGTNLAYSLTWPTGCYELEPASGTLNVSGTPVTVRITSLALPCPPPAPSTFAVTFTERGLPAGAVWSVTLDGTTRSEVGSIAFSAMANGTYAFTITPVTGYRATPSSGSVTVHDRPMNRSVAFASTPGLFGLPGSEGYYALGGVIGLGIVAAAATLVLWRRRSRRRPDESAIQDTSHEGR